MSEESQKLVNLDAVEVYHRGMEYLDYNEPDRAVADFTTVIAVDPKFAHAFFARGHAYASLGDFDRAIADYSEAIRLNPRLVGAYFNRAMAYRECGESEKAAADAAKYKELTEPRE